MTCIQHDSSVRPQYQGKWTCAPSVKRSGHLSRLRMKAEELLRKDPTAIKKLPDEQVIDLIHDLQVHQNELEMQNEELQRAQLELEDSRNRFQDLYNFAPAGYFNIDFKGLIVINKANFILTDH